MRRQARGLIAGTKPDALCVITRVKWTMTQRKHALKHTAQEAEKQRRAEPRWEEPDFTTIN